MKSSSAPSVSTAMVLIRYVGIIVIVGAGLLFSTEYLNQGSLAGLWEWLGTHPNIALVNLALLTAITSFLVFLTNRLDGGCQLALLLLVLPVISSIKQRFLLQPLFPLDYHMVEEAFEVSTLAIDMRMAMAAALGGVFLILALGRGLRQLVTLRLSLVARVGGCVGTAGLFVAIGAHIPSAAAAPALFGSAYHSSGLALGFFGAVEDMAPRTPEDYSGPVMQELIDRRHLAQSPVASSHPDIIAVLSESFWDPSALPKVQFSSPPAPHYRELAAEGHAFSILSPSFAGLTANAEFEFLTGMSLSFESPQVIPYKCVQAGHLLPSIPRFLGSIGYRSVAIHPYYGNFYRRDVVYPAMGFARYDSLAAFSHDGIKGVYTSDDAVCDHIIQELSANTAPTFVWAVTMQNHSPYRAHEYPTSPDDVRGPLPPADLQMLATYAAGIRDADAMLGRLCQFIRQRSRPTILIFFGDHLPCMPVEIYKRGGLVETTTDLQDERRLHCVPAALYSNISGLEPLKEKVISPSLIWSEVLPPLGIEHPFFTSFLGNVRHSNPGLLRDFSLSPDGQIVAGPDHGRSVLMQDYRLLQSDLIWGKGYAFAPLFGSEPRPGASESANSN